MNENKRTIVVKIGGTNGVDFAAISREIPGLLQAGWKCVLVHGGSAEVNQLGEALGHPPRFITSPSGHASRYTDRQTLEIFAMAVNGKVNTLLVEQLQALGVNALGLSGLDGKLLLATRKGAVQSLEDGKRKIIRDDHTGKIEQVNTRLLESLLEAGYTPVVSPLAISPQGEALNVDADRAAAMIAAALRAETLVLLTAAPGLMRDFPDESSLIRSLSSRQLETAAGFAHGRMKKKILGAQEALQGGVVRVIIADGRALNPITQALSGAGTTIAER
ncbi:MAG TPA: [LysW]-aminoadipate kinase [Anaerolineales bacterium]|nr:[LysW]-aminoadipate kinase [Anaerolineales bacterium]